MIPRVIHFCWLSGEEMPRDIKRCLASWREVMPDYEFVKWDTSRFAVESNQFVMDAFRARKWAFAADYIRIHALHAEGGIYLDCDVLVKKRFDEFLEHRFFTAVEYHHDYVREQGTLRLLNADGSSRNPNTPKPGIGIQAAVMGGEKGHPFLKACLDYYKDRRFVLPDGTYNDRIISPDIYAMVAERFGFRYADRRQTLREGMLVLQSSVFAGNFKSATPASHAIHFCAASWRDLPRPGSLRAAVKRIPGLQKLLA